VTCAFWHGTRQHTTHGIALTHRTRSALWKARTKARLARAGFVALMRFVRSGSVIEPPALRGVKRPIPRIGGDFGFKELAQSGGRDKRRFRFERVRDGEDAVRRGA
jgi:hypothetical protein